MEQQPPKMYIRSLAAQVRAKHCAKFGWLPLSDVAAVTKPRRESFFGPKIATLSPPFHTAGEIGKSKTIASICSYVSTSIPNMVGFPPPISEIGCPLGVGGGAGKLWIDITSAVWQLATHCLILGVGFRGQAIQWRHIRDRGSKGRCHGNQFRD